MKKLTLQVAFFLSFFTSIGWAQKTEPMKLYQIYTGEQSLLNCKTPATMYFFQNILGDTSQAQESLRKSQTCADDLILKIQRTFKDLDATLKTPEAKKALRDHYATTKVQLEAGVPEVGASEKQFNDKYKRLEEKRKEAWARLEVETF